MPPKNSPSPHSSTKTTGPTREQLKLIKDYIAKKPDFEELIVKVKANPQSPKEPAQSEYEKILREAARVVFEERKAEAEAKSWKEGSMPVHPKEEETREHIYDQVAKESKDSGASDHALHQNREKAAIQAHQANPGPVMAENLGEPASKEELKNRAEELNQKK